VIRRCTVEILLAKSEWIGDYGGLGSGLRT